MTTLPAIPQRDSKMEQMIKLSEQGTPPASVGTAISVEDWGAMPPDERLAALMFLETEEAGSSKGLPVDFPRIKYPQSESNGYWTLPTPEGITPQLVKALTGVIVFKQTVRVFYGKQTDGRWSPSDQAAANTSPTCMSQDLNVPDKERSLVVQAHTCMECPWSKWGTSGKDGSRGQACKVRVRTFLLMDKDGVLDDIPTLISLPPTALKRFGAYTVQLRQAKSPGGLIGVVSILGLVKATNQGGTPYQALDIATGRKLTYREMRQAEAVRLAFEDGMRSRGFTPETDDDTGGDDAQRGTGAPGAPAGTIIDHGPVDAPARDDDDVPF